MGVTHGHMTIYGYHTWSYDHIRVSHMRAGLHGGYGPLICHTCPMGVRDGSICRNMTLSDAHIWQYAIVSGCGRQSAGAGMGGGATGHTHVTLTLTLTLTLTMAPATEITGQDCM